jgi:hypothetical protein
MIARSTNAIKGLRPAAFIKALKSPETLLTFGVRLSRQGNLATPLPDCSRLPDMFNPHEEAPVANVKKTCRANIQGSANAPPHVTFVSEETGAFTPHEALILGYRC